MKRYTVLVLPLILAAVGFVSAQERFGESVQVTLVEVPVTVADQAGKPVRGLTRENFTLLSDGRPVDIEYFEVVDLKAVAPGESRNLPAAARRNFLLLFDLANSSPGTIRRAQEAAQAFVTGRQGSTDLIAVATSSAERGLALETNFTNDHEFLLGTIATLRHEAGFKVADPLMLVALDGAVPKAVQKSEILDEKAEERQALNAATNQMRADEMRNRVVNHVRNLGSVARALDRLRGQKQIILLSEGFDARLITGRDELGFQATQQENDAVLSGEVWKVDSDQRFGNSGGATVITEMAEIFRRSDVRLHALDIKGIRTDVDAREGWKKSSTEALSLLATPTGGTVFKNANDLGETFDRLLESQEVIYILAFRGRPAGTAKFHTLKVKLVNARGEVAHRSGYFDPSATTHDLERVLTAGEIMMNNIPVEDLKMSVLAMPFVREDGRSDVPVIVEVDGKSLLRQAQGNSLPLEFFIYAFDDLNLIRDHVYERAILDVEKLRDRLAGAGAKFYHTLRLPPGRYSLRVLVRSGGTGNGFRNTDLEVPAAGARYIAPPLVFDHDVSRWVMIRGANRPGVSSEYPFQIGENVFVPSARAVFRPGISSEVAIFTFNARENVDASAHLEGNGAVHDVNSKLAGRTGGANGAEKLLLTVQVPSLPSGSQTLVVTVRGKSGLEAMQVSLPVVVVQ